MSDLIKRLRDVELALEDEAADEIERQGNNTAIMQVHIDDLTAERDALLAAAQAASDAYTDRFGVPHGNYVGPIDDDMAALRAAIDAARKEKK